MQSLSFTLQSSYQSCMAYNSKKNPYPATGYQHVGPAAAAVARQFKRFLSLTLIEVRSTCNMQRATCGKR